MKKVLPALLVLVVLAVATAGAWYLRRERLITGFAATPVTLPPEGVTLLVPNGTGPKTLARQLADTGIVTDPELLYLYIRRVQAGPLLKAGEYLFEGTLTPAQVVEQLASGKVKLYRFTVPEGLRVEEILPILANSELKLDLAALERLASDRGFLREAGVPADSLEGFLFPDTYSFTRNATAEQVLTKMVERSLEEYRKADVQRKNGVKLSLLETFTLASIVDITGLTIYFFTVKIMLGL